MDSSTNHRGLGRGMAVLVLGLLAVAASNADAAQPVPPDGPEQVYALTASDDLLSFDGDEPRDAESNPITGLRGNESLVGIDFRPSGPDATQGDLYGVGDRGNIYSIDEESGEATRVSAIKDVDGDKIPLVGNKFGIDFNPTVDRLRIVSDSNQNLRVNVDTGELSDFDPNTPGTQPDGDLQYAGGDENEGEDPGVTAVAYRNSQPDADGPPVAQTTELYDIDTRLDVLATQNPPNDGTLNTDGPLGRNVKRITGFDIVTVGVSPVGDRAFAALQLKDNESSAFYSVNLDTGEVTRIDRIDGKNTKVEGLAIPIGQE